MAHPLVEVARNAIRTHVAGETEAAPTVDTDRAPWGVFVSLYKPPISGVDSELRGCIGRLDLKPGSLAREVAGVAVSSATADPRFPPLRCDEVEDLDVTVYLLDPPEVVDGPDDLDPKRYGVIVTGSGGRRGLLLPAIPGIDSPERQLELATRKAGLSPGSKVTIERFTAEILN